MEAIELLRSCLPAGIGVGDSYVALSGKNGLRWILPAESKRLSGLLAAWQPYSIPAKVGWGLICLAAKGGFLSRMPGAEKFDAELSTADWRDYGWAQTEPPVIIAYVGTPGAHRKLVVTLANPSNGEGRLVIKYPLTDTAWEKIDREYTILKEFWDKDRKLTPEPVRIDREKRFTVQTYLAGRPAGVRLTNAHYRFLANLYRPDMMISLEEVRSQITSRRDSLIKRGKMSRKDLAHLECLLNENCWHGNVPGVRIHGDFAPWNLKWSGIDTIRAVDWEDAKMVGLPSYDLQFYEMQVARLLEKKVRADRNRYACALADAGYPRASIEEARTRCAAQALAVITMLEQTYAFH